MYVVSNAKSDKQVNLRGQKNNSICSCTFYYIYYTMYI